MILIQELRIHNLVSITEAARKELFDCNEVLFEENTHRVSGLDIDELRLFIDSMEVEFDYSQIEPIELTGEWLIKCNVVKRSVYGTTVIARIVDSIGIPDYIKSVHELQNWYYWEFHKTELTIKK